MKAKVLVCHGADDTLSKDEISAFKEEMEHAKADYQFVAYPNAMHRFTNPEATEKGKRFGIPLAYEAEADRRSWEDMKQFLARVLV